MQATEGRIVDGWLVMQVSSIHDAGNRRQLTVLQRRNFTKRASLTQKRQLDKIVQVLMLEVLGLLMFFEVSRFLVFRWWNLPR